MPLLLGQLVYTSFPVVGFKALASTQVPSLIQQAFMEKVVHEYWNSYNPPGFGYRAIYLHQLDPEHTLFGWLYNDGRDDMGRSHVPYFVCYYLAEQLDADQLEIILTCLQRGPVALIDRQSPPVAVETVVASDLWSYQPAQMGVAIPAEVCEYSHSALKQRKLINLFNEQASEAELSGQTYRQQRVALAVHSRHLVVEGIEMDVGSIETAAGVEVLEPYQAYQKGLQVYEQVLVDAVEHESPLSDRTRIRLELLQQASGLKDEDIASIQERIARQSKAVSPLEASESVVRSTSRRQATTSVRSLDTVAVREKPLSTRPAPSLENRVSRFVPARRSFQLLVVGMTATVVAGVYGLRQWQARFVTTSPQVIENLPGTGWQNVRAQTLSGHSGSVWSAAITPDGQTLVSGSEDQTVKIWNLGSGKLLRTLSGYSDTVRSVVISPDGQTLVSGIANNTIKIRSLGTGELLHTLTGHSAPVWSVAISPDGQTLVSSSGDQTIKVWNLQTGELLRTLSGHSNWVFSIAISPDGQTIVSGSKDQTIKIWNLKTGELLHTLSGHLDTVRSVAINSDGQTFVSSSWDKTIKIWNLQTGELLRTLSGHTSRVVSVAISPDGQTLASGSLDQTIKVWDLRSGELLKTLPGHSDWILSIVYGPQSDYSLRGGFANVNSSNRQVLVSGSKDKTIKVWR